jgi:hypothetical protein
MTRSLFALLFTLAGWASAAPDEAVLFREWEKAQRTECLVWFQNILSEIDSSRSAVLSAQSAEERILQEIAASDSEYTLAERSRLNREGRKWIRRYFEPRLNPYLALRERVVTEFNRRMAALAEAKRRWLTDEEYEVKPSLAPDADERSRFDQILVEIAASEKDLTKNYLSLEALRRPINDSWFYAPPFNQTSWLRVYFIDGVHNPNPPKELVDAVTEVLENKRSPLLSLGYDGVLRWQNHTLAIGYFGGEVPPEMRAEQKKAQDAIYARLNRHLRRLYRREFLELELMGISR